MTISENTRQWREAGIMQAMADHLLELSGPVAGLDVLDVACGVGTCAAAFGGAGAGVSAIDSDADMVIRCRQKAADAGLFSATDAAADAGWVRPNLADAHDLPFEDGRFDLVTANGGLSNIADPARALREAGRVLKPDGRLAIGDFLIPESAIGVWGAVMSFSYGYQRAYLHYSQLVDLLYGTGFQVEAY